jgi:hypothetical protein
VHYTLQQYGNKYGAEYSNNPKYRSKTRDILVSAYDTFKNKRVIVDGIHRAAVMSSTYSGRDDEYGSGLVNAAAAVGVASKCRIGLELEPVQSVPS